MNLSVNPKLSGPEALAHLVARCRRFAAGVQDLSELPTREESPFLYQQLEKAYRDLKKAVEQQVGKLDEAPEEEHSESSFFGFFKRSKRKGERDAETPEGQGADKGDGLIGNSWTIPLPDLIGFLAACKKAGVLWVYSSEETFVIEMRNGNLIHATSDRTPPGLRIGEILINQGVLTNEKLHQFLIARRGKKGMLGAALKESGVITGAQLDEALNYQVQQIFYRIMATEHSVFRFQEGEGLTLAHHVHLNATQVMLEAARLRDERAHQEHGGGAPNMEEEVDDEASSLFEDITSLLPSEYLYGQAAGEEAAVSADDKDGKPSSEG